MRAGTPEQPEASPGRLCIYIASASNATSIFARNIRGTTGGGDTSYGFRLDWAANAAGQTSVRAGWAYTAP